ncbi:Signal transduction histidine kinase [Amycolatopsis saalfeldensis]|uniref:histidine kinase n=1 Tax=Amycolatopsis saalfeldensis TaxID=394193 RepID=A0A1H8X7B5_9PSEU|nr:histidine kinase [Amycolatopsis saalfeldensis]SEP35826.1 Signal transduction histidine kinase [Amycolatopsis saalfeldensis]
MPLRPLRRPALFRPRELPARQQDGLIALFIVLIGLAIYLTGMHRLLPGPDPFGLWVRLLELAALGGLAFLRRWVPGGLLLATGVLVTDLVLGPSLPVVVVYTDFLYAATVYGTRRTTRVLIGVTAAATLSVLVGAVAASVEWRMAVLASLGILPFLLVPVWWGANVRQHRDAAATERAHAAQLSKIAELDQRAAVAEERARMARDLHDVIAGHLSAIALQSEAALSMADDPKMSRAVLEAVRENSVSALEEMRAMIGLLRAASGTGGPDYETTAPARLAELSRLVESARATGMEVTVDSTVDTGAGLPAAVDLTAYRIAQEALTNAVKHAPGGRVLVQLRREGGLLTVEVGNELRTAAARTGGTGNGLASMAERARAVGGTLSAGPSGPGWLVRAELPLAEGRT